MQVVCVRESARARSQRESVCVRLCVVGFCDRHARTRSRTHTSVCDEPPFVVAMSIVQRTSRPVLT